MLRRSRHSSFWGECFHMYGVMSSKQLEIFKWKLTTSCPRFQLSPHASVLPNCDKKFDRTVKEHTYFAFLNRIGLKQRSPTSNPASFEAARESPQPPSDFPPFFDQSYICVYEHCPPRILFFQFMELNISHASRDRSFNSLELSSFVFIAPFEKLVSPACENVIERLQWTPFDSVCIVSSVYSAQCLSSLTHHSFFALQTILILLFPRRSCLDSPQVLWRPKISDLCPRALVTRSERTWRLVVHVMPEFNAFFRS